MKPIDELNQLISERESIYDAIAKASGLPKTSFMVLYFIRNEEEETTQAQIADDFFYPRQSVNSACVRLGKEGLIELVIQKAKGHHKLVRLTEKGIRFCEKWVDVIIRADSDCFASLSKEDQAVFLSLYHRQMAEFRSIVKKSNVLNPKL